MSDSTTSTSPASDGGAPPPQVWPTLRARDANALISFLVDVVGFTETVVYRDGDTVHHAELTWPLGGGIMIGSATEGEDVAPPLRSGSFSAYVVCEAAEAVDGVHARVLAAGTTILLEPYDTDYGSHEFAFEDREGNRWSFGTWRGHPRT
jgi:uncharacterized glyoxalase superfamily protein PhnB